MRQPERFGPFLLFQETESNSYRSCYRAGLVKGRAVERIVRLEIFDRPGLNISRLKRDVDWSADLRSRLRDPHIAPGAGLGQVEGTPFVACDFELGTTLAAFSRAARQRSFPVPFDQALFIAERVALALAAAYQVDHEGHPILHSFLTPDAVLLSNSGEVKVCGFEVARALREQLAGEPTCAPYLSSECRAGQPPAAQDDVFSLGAMLYELITGCAPPADSPGPIEIGALVVQSTGEPAPGPVRSLLEASFAPAAHRIPHPVAWQRSLGKLILDGEHNPTTFNLAFLLHTLLREPLERGVEALEREKRFVLSASEATRAASRGGATSTPIAAGAETSSAIPAAVADATGDAAAGGRAPFWLGFSISCLAASAALGLLLTSGGGAHEAASGPALQAAVVPPTASSPAASRPSRNAGQPSPPAETAAPRDPTQPNAVPASERASPVVLSEVVRGELDPLLGEDEIRRLVAERTAEIERNLKAEYERKLDSLRLEVEQIEQAGPAPRPVEAERAVGSEGAARQDLAGVPEPPPDQASEAGARAEPEPEPRPALAVAPDEVSARSALGELSETSGLAEPADGPELSGGSGTDERAEPAARPGPGGSGVDGAGASRAVPEARQPGGPDGATSASSEAPPTQAGFPAPDAPAETRAQLLRLSPPSYPPVARRLGLSATARVRVLVGPEGRVRDAELLGPTLGAGFDAAALAAARRSRWKPATLDGEPVESWSVVTLEFRP